MTNRYPWYEIVQGDRLEQGDLLSGCPVISPIPNFTYPPPDDEMPSDLQIFDVVVMTNSCDLVNEKVTDVILCPHWDLKDAASLDSELKKVAAQEEIRKGRRPRYVLLAASDFEELPMGVRIVDFGRIFSLPKAFLSRFAASRGKRLHLCPPYREHLSQSFARFFMRVGLPKEIELPK